jgi:hypothetical protein
MESQGLPGRIQLADSTRRRLNGAFLFEERGVIDVRGMGEMHTWFLNGRTAQDIGASSVFAAHRQNSLA